MTSLVKKQFIQALRQKHLFRVISNVTAYTAVNEPMLEYGPGSQERNDLDEALRRFENKVVDIPIVVGDEEIRTIHIQHQLRPFDHQKKVASFYYATPDVLKKAISVSLKARKDWERRSLDERSKIFLKAADLISQKYRMDILATTILGQAKTIHQAEIDAGAELPDFLRFNVMFAQQITSYQPISPNAAIRNCLLYRGMEGFWVAVCPFNFTAIGAHLPMAPALMGNVALWKPSDSSVLSNYIAFQAYREAGLPPGVINFVPADGPVFGDTLLASPHLAGINFTGSLRTFKLLWRQVAENLDSYKSFPRLIGECGGKNMHFVHASADIQSVIFGTIRSAFEYNGQKCSACSRMYVPQSIWPAVRDGMLKVLKEIKMGSPLDKECFVTAVIDAKAFDRIKSYLDFAKNDKSHQILFGGNCNDSKGYFVEPTLVETKDPKSKLLQEEIFGPVLTVYPYPDNKFKENLDLANNTSPYSLTGAIFVQEPAARNIMVDVLRDAAGNFYINDKSTGAVVGQQPFGGSRLSGTNDKAGGPHYLNKFVSQQSVKESLEPTRDWRYPYMKN